MIKTIFTYRGSKINIRIDESEFNENTLLIAVANGRYYGGGMLPAPEAKIDDGLFHICHIKHVGKLKMLALFPRFMKGKHGNLREVSMLTGRNIRIEADSDMPVNIDGEIFYSSQIIFEIIQGGINIIVPK